MFGAASPSPLLDSVSVPAQLLLAVLGLAFVQLQPRAGEPALLYSPSGAVRPALIDVLDDPSAQMLGRGSLPDTVIVSTRDPQALSMLWEHGVVMVSAAPAWCGSSQENVS